MRTAHKFAAGLLLLALLGGVLVLTVARRSPPGTESSDTQDHELSSPTANSQSSFGPGAYGEPLAKPVAEILVDAFERLSASAPPRDVQDILENAASALESASYDEAKEAILAALRSGRDADTGLPLVPGEESLAGAPTWRVFLLDRLGLLDPRLAAEYARQAVFPLSNSAEEWAVSLRNVLHSYPPSAAQESRTEISELLTRMFANSDWRAQRAQGLLESLDFVAHTREPAVQIATLDTWSGSETDTTIATAAQIAVERTMEQRGDDLLPLMAAQTAGDAAGLRASAMARADLRRPAQSQAVGNFLRSLPKDSSEAVVFFRAFPLHRYSVAPGLAGVPRVPDAQDMKAADEAALVVVDRWRTDPTMSAHHEALSGLADKLHELTGNIPR